MKLYDYQYSAVCSVRERWRQHQNLLGVAATGSGKTIIFLSVLLGADALPALLQAHQRALILTHRTELVQQAVERIHQFWPAWSERVGVVQSNQNTIDAQIVVGSVRTLAHERRLAQVFDHGAIDYLIIDEAHHANAPTYRYVIDALRAANPRLLHLGVTATPERHDADGLSAVYDDVAFTFGIKELVERGYLSPPRWLGIETDVSLAGVRSVNKTGNVPDFQTTALSARFDTSAMHDLVVQIHQEYATGRKAIAFTPSVAGAQSLAERLGQAGITATWVSGKHPRRAELVQAFRDGQYQVVVNAQVLVEGFDQPDVDCIHMVRPTRSDAFYLQCIGRSLRQWPGKVDALIIDYLPLEERNITLLGDVLGLPRIRHINRHQRGERGAVAGAFTFDGTFLDADSAPIRFSVRELDYLGHANAVRWSDEMIAQLGDAPDRELAARWGVTQTLVTRKRNELGIAPFSLNTSTWTPEREARLGTAPDYRLAAEWGISKVAVRQRRMKLSILSYREDATTWPAAHAALLGTDHDRAIAAQLGISVEAVKYQRQKRGIPAHGDKPVIEWTPDLDHQLGTAPDRELAAAWGVSTSTVRNRRVLLGIPAFKSRQKGE